MIELIRFNARSSAGVPFVWINRESQSHRIVIPSDAVTELDASPQHLAQIACTPCVEAEYPSDHRALDFAIASERTRREAVRRETASRHDDPRCFPTTVFIRARRRKGDTASMEVQELSFEWRAYEVTPEQLTWMRFHPLIEAEFLVDAAAPPLTHVRLRFAPPSAHLGGPVTRTPSTIALGRSFTTTAFTEVELYPWELARVADQKRLRFEIEPDVATFGADLRALAPEPTTGPEASGAPVQLVARHAPVAVPQAAIDDAALVPRERSPSVTVPVPHAENDGAAAGDADAAQVATIVAWANTPAVRDDAIARGGLAMYEVLKCALGVARADARRGLEIRVARALRECGWEHLPLCHRNGERVRPYRPRLAIE